MEVPVGKSIREYRRLGGLFSKLRRVWLSKSLRKDTKIRIFNPLNPELNHICYLLALLAHHFLHVSRIRVKSLTIRLLMSYIYGVNAPQCSFYTYNAGPV